MQTMFYLPPEISEWLNEYAKRMTLSRSQIVKRLLLEEQQRERLYKAKTRRRGKRVSG